MRGLSLKQPWATLVAIGAKRIETRSKLTNYRGPVAIHASLGKDELMFVTNYDGEAFPEHRAILAALREAGYARPYTISLPRGAIVAVAEIVDCQPIIHHNVPPTPERYFGNYTPDVGRYAWHLANVRRLPEPIPCKGALGIWTVPADVAALVEVQLAGRTVRACLEGMGGIFGEARGRG